MGVDMAKAVRGVSLTLTILCDLICCLALYARRSAVKSLGLEDFLILVALVMINGNSALAFASTYYGLGVHNEDVLAKDMAVWLKMYYASLIYTLITSAVVKVSIIVSIIRFFPLHNTIIIGRAMIASLVLFTVSGAFVLAFQCDPVRSFWDTDRAGDIQLETPSCSSSDTRFGMYKYQAVLMFATDAVLIVLPILETYKLHLPLKGRLQLLLVFGLGLLACIAAGGRIGALVYMGGMDDETYTSAIPFLCTILELNIAMITISLPSIRSIPFKAPALSNSNLQRKPTRLHYASSRPHTETVYELGLNRSQRRKRGDGILKISEVHTSFHEWRASMLSRPESQEGLAGDSGGSSGRGIYGAGTGGLGGVKS
ncbi:uncharacterized protein BDV14DRAFT_203068 [Aspergillus stella-maris]|uniref:uncharacterized protein n=1 Tax=Aspergillus stella-maris TaxID=1810926 RepID=UPI003CCD969D